MAHYARVLDGKVQEVIVADQDFIDNLVYDKPGKWIQTSYNTKGGVHVNGGTPLRKNYAGKNWTYDVGRDAFIPPKPESGGVVFESWVLNEDTCLWDPPVAMPDDDQRYRWNETEQRWDVWSLPE
jgi:hypothetical protein